MKVHKSIAKIRSFSCNSIYQRILFKYVFKNNLYYFFIFAVMGRVNTPQLSTSERLALEAGLKSGNSHCFRNRCQVILLKADGRKSKDVGTITAMSHISVNSWVKRFKSEGITGLHNKSGQGRKPLLGIEDKQDILCAIKSHRQRLQTAKAQWEASKGKQVSHSTFRRFLKVLTENISE